MELAELPTPVERLKSVSEQVGADIWVKRDDLTSTVYGGNKVRKLEYLLGDALAGTHDSVITSGAAGSHHVLATGLFGAELGLSVSAVLMPQRYSPHAEEHLRAATNLGIDLRQVRSAATLLPAVSMLATRMKLARRSPYVIAPGGSSVPGIIGWVEAGLELSRQIESNVLPEPAEIVAPMGTSGTVTGLAIGARRGGDHLARDRGACGAAGGGEQGTHPPNGAHDRRRSAEARLTVSQRREHRARRDRDRRARARPRIRRGDERGENRDADRARARRIDPGPDLLGEGVRRSPAPRARDQAIDAVHSHAQSGGPRSDHRERSAHAAVAAASLETVRDRVKLTRMLLAFALTMAFACGAESEPAHVPRPEPERTPEPAVEDEPAAPPEIEDVYEAGVDAQAQINAAVARAADGDKRVLLMFGANWCEWCRRLEWVFRNEERVSARLTESYELVHVDVGARESDTNRDVARRYGDPLTNGLPCLVVLNEAGEVEHVQETGSLEEGDHHDPALVLAFLDRFVPAAPE